MAGFKIKLDQRHISAFVLGGVILIVDFIFFAKTSWFVPLIVIALTIAWSQHWIDFFVKAKLDKELEEKFPEFVRNLVSAVKSGMPMTKAIMQVSHTDYGALNPYVQKLANQVEWAIPMHKALMNFAHETDNSIITRAMSTVIEAEQSGGNIEDVLETITASVLEIKKIKQERKASIHGQIVQSYIIFIVFLGVMVAIQNLLIPYIAEISSGEGDFGADLATMGGGGGGAGINTFMDDVSLDFSSVPNFFGSIGAWLMSVKGVFLMLSGIQGLFAGLVLGQLAEGNIKAGLKHSLILVTMALFIITLAQGAMNSPADAAATAMNATVGLVA